MIFKSKLKLKIEFKNIKSTMIITLKIKIIIKDENDNF